MLHGTKQTDTFWSPNMFFLSFVTPCNPIFGLQRSNLPHLLVNAVYQVFPRLPQGKTIEKTAAEDPYRTNFWRHNPVIWGKQIGRMRRRMTNKWMNEWTNEWKKELLNEWMDGWMYGRMSGWVTLWLSAWMNEWMSNERTHEWVK